MKQYQKSSAKVQNIFDICNYFTKKNELFLFCNLYFANHQKSAR